MRERLYKFRMCLVALPLMIGMAFALPFIALIWPHKINKSNGEYTMAWKFRDKKG